MSTPLPHTASMHGIDGSVIDFRDPENTEITRDNLSFGLARKPRYHGLTRHCWSVLDHLVLGIRIATQHMLAPPERVRLWALHDAHEAFFGEWPKGLKVALGPPLAAYEERWEAVVHRHYDTAWPRTPDDTAWVKALDEDCLLAEMWALAHPGLDAAQRQVGRGALPEYTRIVSNMLTAARLSDRDSMPGAYRTALFDEWEEAVRR